MENKIAHTIMFLKGDCYITQPNISKNEFYQVVNKKLKNNNKFQIKENKDYTPPSFKSKIKIYRKHKKPNNGWNADGAKLFELWFWK